MCLPFVRSSPQNESIASSEKTPILEIEESQVDTCACRVGGAENPKSVIRNFGVMVTMASTRSNEGSSLSEESETETS